MEKDGLHPVRSLTGLAQIFHWSRFLRDSQEVLEGQKQRSQDPALETELRKEPFNLYVYRLCEEQIMNDLHYIMRIFSRETRANKYCIPVLVSQVYSEEINLRMLKSFLNV